MARMWRTGSTTLPEPGFTLGADHGGAFGNAADGFTEISRATDEARDNRASE